MSIKHIYEHLLEHFICLKSFIITAKFSCCALWAKSWSSFSLNSHWLQQEGDLIVCGFPYKFNTALNKMGLLVSTILRQQKPVPSCSKQNSELSLWGQLKKKKKKKPHAHKSVTFTLYYKNSLTPRRKVQVIQVLHPQKPMASHALVGCSTINHSLSDHSLMLPLPKPLSSVPKPSMARIQPGWHWSPPLTHSVVALGDTTRQPGPRHTEPEGIAGEQPKESNHSGDILYNFFSLAEFYHHYWMCL